MAVTRSFGDHGMKDFVSADPYQREVNLTALGDCPLLILACDGVWDVLTDQEAGDLILDELAARGGVPLRGGAGSLHAGHVVCAGLAPLPLPRRWSWHPGGGRRRAGA